MKIAFLDRDGVINEYPGDAEYVNNHREFKFIPGSAEGIAKLNRCGFKVYVISNQAGVSKGLYSQNDLELINKKMINQLAAQKASVSGIYYCIHHPHDNCNCRKPRTMLLERALSGLDANSCKTFFIGDSFLDMNAARNFGSKSILVLSGKEKESNRENWEFEPDLVFENLLEAADYLCLNYA